jgi:hypothetical protein
MRPLTRRVSIPAPQFRGKGRTPRIAIDQDQVIAGWTRPTASCVSTHPQDDAEEVQRNFAPNESLLLTIAPFEAIV